MMRDIFCRNVKALNGREYFKKGNIIIRSGFSYSIIEDETLFRNLKKEFDLFELNFQMVGQKRAELHRERLDLFEYQ